MTRATSESAMLPRPAGPYSHAASVAGIIHTAGQSGADRNGNLAASIGVQAQHCFRNVLASLASQDAAEDDVVKVTVYLTDTQHFVAMNEVYAEFFNHPFPARTTVYLTLPDGMLIEADAVAIRAGG